VFAAILEAQTVPPIDPNTLPKDADALRKIVLDLCEQLRHESSEKDKYVVDKRENAGHLRHLGVT
jgi:hypothetical protein